MAETLADWNQNSSRACDHIRISRAAITTIDTEQRWTRSYAAARATLAPKRRASERLRTHPDQTRRRTTLRLTLRRPQAAYPVLRGPDAARPERCSRAEEEAPLRWRFLQGGACCIVRIVLKNVPRCNPAPNSMTRHWRSRPPEHQERYRRRDCRRLEAWRIAALAALGRRSRARAGEFGRRQPPTRDSSRTRRGAERPA